jgi:hypothetical protein
MNLIQVNDLYVDVYQLDETFRGNYKVRFGYYDFREKVTYFCFLEGGKLHWFFPNKHYSLTTSSDYEKWDEVNK